MSKFASKTTARQSVASPVKSKGGITITHEGGTGHLRDAKSELYLLAVANMVGENTFYEATGERDDRFRDLISTVTLSDPDWIARFVPYLRSEMNMRSASVVMAAEYALALKSGGNTAREGAPSPRAVIASALQRADEPGEFIGYWKLRTGRTTLPGGVQRGVADAVSRLFTEYAALKYDGKGKAIRLGDVIELSHPSAKGDWQGDLYGYLLDRRHNPGEVRTPLDRLPMTAANIALDEVPADQRKAFLRSEGAAARLKAAGFTWEELSGWLGGPMDAAAWGSVIPSMGYMALLRNLRNFDQAGVSDDIAEGIAAKLADPEQVAKSRQFPFRFLAAYKAAPSLRWGYALEKALNLSLSNVPSLTGRTLILVDRSGSMWDRLSAKSDLNRADAAAIFGTALAARAESADLVQFDTGSALVAMHKGESVLKVLERFAGGGGTSTAAAVAKWYARHDRVIIVTDEQAANNYYGGDPAQHIPANVPLYTWNLAGYAAGHTASGDSNRHTFAGLTDSAFRMIPLIEAGRSADWPF